MASVQCHKPCDQTNHSLQKSHSADKCYDKHQSGHIVNITHDKHQTSAHCHGHGPAHGHGPRGHGHGHGHGHTTLTDKVKAAVHNASKILHPDNSHKHGSHTKPTGHCLIAHNGHLKTHKKKTHHEGHDGHCKPKVKSLRKKTHKENNNSDCSDSDSGGSSSSDSESDCNKPKRKNC